MSNREFDWTMILPEEERRKALADRQTFFDKFPTKSEIEQAGREGREAFAKACAQVDRNRINDLVTELRKLQDIIDSQAGRILDLEAAVAMTNGQ
jgi:hypothetical protein